MRPFTDKTGNCYGHITVLRLLPGMNVHSQRRYLCRCDCGTEFIATSNNLREGGSRSCGCGHRRTKSTINDNG